MKKAILAAENMAKGGMPVGTIRELGGIESKQSLMERFLDIKKSVSSILSKLARKDRSIKEMVSDVLNETAWVR